MPIDDPLNEAMLAHAVVIYRGYARSPGPQAALRAAMEELLATLSPVKGQWQIVWGPATFRGDPDPFADAAMYVARRHPSAGMAGREQLVVVVRGTNPISLFDWVFGDLLVLRQVPWPYGPARKRAGTAVSASTALGLGILQGMRSEMVDGVSEPPASRGAVALAPAPILDQGLLQVLGGARATLLGSSSPLGEEATGATAERFRDWALSIAQRRASIAWRDALGAVEAVLGRAGGEGHEALGLPSGAPAARPPAAGGVTLQQFLRDQTRQAQGKLDVFITGHSKGGALTTALATWLADTQGAESVAPAQRWDPDRVAAVHAYAFAGPTAGNGAFARHADAALGGRCHRIFNPLDIVPHAFATRDLKTIPRLYDPALLEREALEVLAASLARAVAPLDYRHTRADRVELEARLVPGLPLVAQAIHQHVDSYFRLVGLGRHTGPWAFLDDLL